MGKQAAAVVAVVLAVWVVNAPTLDYGFVYDDHAVVVERGSAWQQGWSAFFEARSWGVGRHAALLSLDLDRRDPLDPRPFHVTNTTLATVNAVLVWCLATSLGLPRVAALTAALVFALHPAHVDAVVSIVGRAELLAALGVLGAILLHLHGYFDKILFCAVAGLLFFVALASKESAVVLLLLLVLSEWFGFKCVRGVPRPRSWPLAYLIALAAWLALVARYFATIDPILYVDNPLAHMAGSARIERAGELLWHYMAWAFWPFGLKPDHGYADIGVEAIYGPTSWLAWTVLAIFGLGCRRRFPALGFALLWLPAAFAVTANVAMPIGTLMAERLLYLPSVGPCLVVGIVVATYRCEGSRFRRTITSTLIASMLLTLAFAYDQRARVWAHDAHYHEQAAALSPRSAKAHFNLGLSFARRKLYADAAASFARALVIVPDFGEAAIYRAEALARLGDLASAAAAYEAYLAAAPADTEVLRRLAHLEASLGRHAEALQRLRRALELAPERDELRFELVEMESRLRALSP